MNFSCEYDLAHRLYRRFKYMQEHFPNDSITEVAMTFSKEDISGIDLKLFAMEINKIFSKDIFIDGIGFSIDELADGSARVYLSSTGG